MSHFEKTNSHFSNATLWVGAFVVMLSLYIFVYPILIFSLDAYALNFFEAVEDLMEVTASPLEWLSDKVDLYDRYLKFLVALIYR